MTGVTKDVDLFRESGDEAQRRAARQEAASQLIVQICSLDQAARLYSIDNSFVRRLLDEMFQHIVGIQRSLGEAVSLTSAGYSIFLNRRLVALDFNQYRKAQQLQRAWEAVGIDEVTFDTGLTAEGLLEFAAAYFALLKDPGTAGGLLGRSCGGVTLRKVVGEEAGKREDPGNLTPRVYCSLVALTRTLIRQNQAGQPMPLLRIKRTLQVLVTLIEEHQGLLLALTGVPSLKSELATHLVNTAVLALLLGARLGLTRRELMGLATAALMHDLPKAGIKEGTLNNLERPASVPPEERPRVDLHWLSGVQRMIHLGGLSDETLVRLVVLYESQLEFSRQDLYQHVGDLASEGISLFSRIIAICNLFDTLTWAREGKETITPHRAVAFLLSQAGAQLEPSLVSLFLEVVGLYPTGSLVLLNTNEIGLVTMQNLDMASLPVVRIVVDAQGQPVDGPVVDTGRDATRQLLWPLKAGPLGVNPAARVGTAA